VAAEEEGFKVLPPLSFGPIANSAAVAIDESESDQGLVLLLGGIHEDGSPSSAVQKVDLGCGVCTPQPPLLSQHGVLARRAHRLRGHEWFFAKNGAGAGAAAARTRVAE
jgi:hypothetical protein